MDEERVFMICDVCKNQVGVIHRGGGTMMCCGQPMRELVPNTQEAATEKHIPALTRDGNRLHVQVGQVLHPATPEHHIEWIAVAQGNKTERMSIEVGKPPIADFELVDGPVVVYAYCNLHGLWKAEG